VFSKYYTKLFIRKTTFLHHIIEVLDMTENTEYIQIGITSVILGILSLIFFIIGWFFFSFVDNRLYGMAISLILSIIAILLGYIAYKHGDSYGKYGIILGGCVIIITIIIAVLTIPTSVEIG
jgi:lipopolysaccharide export LptBFGC system permease protein LptF